MASLFGLANIIQSLHQGQLSVPIARQGEEVAEASKEIINL